MLSIGYGMVTEWFWRGQTLGKRVLRLRVVDEAGLALRPSQIVVRNLLRAVDFLPVAYGFGLTAMLLDGRFRRLGDLAAGTMVIYDAPAQQPIPAPHAEPSDRAGC